MKIYLCGPINGRSDSDCRNWRERAKKEWPGECIDPVRRDYRGREAECVDEIVENDLIDIRDSDALLVYFDKPSVGTSMEVFYAKQIGKPVVVIDASDKPLSPWLVYHADHIVREMGDAMYFLHAVTTAETCMTTPDTDVERMSREAFEKAISAPTFERSVKRFPNDHDKFAWPGDYRDPAVSLAWHMWREAAALLERERKRADDAEAECAKAEKLWKAESIRAERAETTNGGLQRAGEILLARADKAETRFAECERDAQIGAAIQRAAGVLPEHYSLAVWVERGAGWVTLVDPNGKDRGFDVDSDNRLAAEIDAAIDAAMKTEGHAE